MFFFFQGTSQWWSTGVMIEKLRFQVPGGVVGECLSPEFGRFVEHTSKVAGSRTASERGSDVKWGLFWPFMSLRSHVRISSPRCHGRLPQSTFFFFNLSVLTLILWYPLHPRVTAVARKRSRSFCQRCMWQVTAKHTCTLSMWL